MSKILKQLSLQASWQGIELCRCLNKVNFYLCQDAHEFVLKFIGMNTTKGLDQYIIDTSCILNFLIVSLVAEACLTIETQNRDVKHSNLADALKVAQQPESC